MNKQRRRNLVLRIVLTALAFFATTGSFIFLIYLLKEDGDSLIFLAIFAAIFFGLQFLFLLPAAIWRVRLAERGRPMKLSVAVGAVAATAITVGMIGTFIEIGEMAKIDLSALDLEYAIIPGIGATWVFWCVVFFFRHTGQRYQQLSSLVKRLIGGTILELFVSIPTLAFNPEPDSCTCARGSFWGVVMGTVTLLWTFGPGVGLLYLGEIARRHRARSRHRCRNCDYDLSGTLAAGLSACPECGAQVTLGKHAANA